MHFSLRLRGLGTRLVPSQISLQQFSMGRPQTDQPDRFWCLCTGITPPQKCHINLSKTTVDREIFALKIIRMKFFLNFRGFVRSANFFLTVDDSSMDERLESSWRLVYFQASGEPGIAGCSRRSDIYLGECGVARASLFTDHRRVILFFA